MDATPGNSPTFAASAGAAVKQELLDPRGLPVLSRRTTSLKSAQGFRVSVKRVRLYLPGGKPALGAEPLKPAEQQGELLLFLSLLPDSIAPIEINQPFWEDTHFASQEYE